MGMTIDEKHIENIKIVKAFMEVNPIVSMSDEMYQSFDYAIDTMRKYQQIEEIVKQYKKFGNIDFSMQIISGVVEDGNDD